ncbi:hypothetical protein DRH13_03950 [Candidatus Woesebacteria bacterium]|nr:MAG: hypothetical protein DRH13_03950 [Candidatus Woesebacteria bacterium]
MKKFLGALLTGFALFFSIPTILILASWSAIPGDTLYSVKSSLEDVALALTANTRIATTFSVNFTDRRFNEAAILLDKRGSTVGYELLVAEAKQSRSMILSERDFKNGTQLAQKIEEYQADIRARQAIAQNLAGSPTPAPYVAPDPTTPPADEKKTVILITTVEVVIEEEDDEEVVEKLEDILEDLEIIKDDIEEELPDMEVKDAPSGPDSSSMDEGEETPEAEESPAEETPEAEEKNDNNKDKDKEKPPKDNEEDLEE